MSADGNDANHVLTELDAGILCIRLNRPEKKNAVTQAMYVALFEALERADQDDEVRVLFITGVGGSFCAGNDVADFLTLTGDADANPGIRFIKALPMIRKPVVAAVNGAAVGIGTTMLLHFDLVYAAEGTRFRLPFVNLGLCPEAASSYLLPRMAGHQRAAEMLLLGQPFDAQTARDVGIVNAVLPTEDLLDAAMAKAREFAAQPPRALQVTRALMRHGITEILSETIDREMEHFVQLTRSPEAAEAVQAFLQRRKPDFSKLK